jgi:chromosome segregation ATPase
MDIGSSNAIPDGATALSSKKEHRVEHPPKAIEPTTKSRAGEEARAKAVIDLAGVFKKLIDEATDSAALKSQKSAAKKKLDKRTAEYLKSKPHHEKFPSTEESQRRAKEQAEKEFKVINEKFMEKDTSLNKLAADVATSVIPGILGTGGADTEEQQKWRSHCEALENTCESLKKKLDGQQKFIEEELILRKQLEGKFDAFDGKLKNLQVSLAETKGRQVTFEKDVRPQMQESISNSEKMNENLKQDITKATSDLSQLSTHFGNHQTQTQHNLVQISEKVDSLSNRVDDADLRTGFSKVKEESAQIAKRFEKVELTVFGNGTENAPGLHATCLQLATDQDRFREELRRWGDVETRVIQVEKRLALATYDNRLKALEKAYSPQKLESEINSLLAESAKVIKAGQESFKNFEQRLGALETAKAARPLSPRKTTTVDHNVLSRLHSLEDQVRSVGSIEKRVSSFETNTASCVKLPALENLSTEVAAIKTKLGSVEQDQRGLSSKLLKNHADPIEFEKRLAKAAVAMNASFDGRLSALEKQSWLARGTSTPVVSGEADSVLSSKLDVLREDFDSFKESQEAADEFTAKCLNAAANTAKAVKERMALTESKISLLEDVNISYNHLLELPGKLESLQESQVHSVQQYQNDLINAKKSIVTFSVAEAVKATQTQLEALPSTLTNTIGQLNNKIGELDNRVEGNSLAVFDLDKRYQGINTLDMANYILGQLSETYPNVRHAQTQLVAFNASLHNTINQLTALDSSFQGLQTQVQNLENRAQQSPLEEGRTSSSLRKDVDKVTEDLMKEQKNVRSAVKDAKDAKDALSGFEENIVKFHEEVAQHFADIDLKLELKGVEIADLSDKMDKLQDTIQSKLDTTFNSLKESEQALAQQIANLSKVPAASPAPSNGSRSNANGTISHKGPQAPFSPPLVPTIRQASLESSASNKRRMLENGTAALTTGKPNGVNGRRRSASNASSPQKRSRRRFDVGSDHDDPDYEIPQPGISSDDED